MYLCGRITIKTINRSVSYLSKISNSKELQEYLKDSIYFQKKRLVEEAMSDPEVFDAFEVVIQEGIGEEIEENMSKLLEALRLQI